MDGVYDLKTAFFINSLKGMFFKQAYEKVEVNIITVILNIVFGDVHILINQY